jgi:site-specific recombinase XerD
MDALAQLRKDEDGNDKEIGKVFSITESQLRKQWESAREEIGSKDLHWHDLRHEATSRLFHKGLNVFEVTSITGHKTLAELKKYAHMDRKTILRKMNTEFEA